MHADMQKNVISMLYLTGKFLFINDEIKCRQEESNSMAPITKHDRK